MNVVKPVFLPVLGVLGMAAVLLSLCGCGGGSGSDPAPQTVTTTGRVQSLAFSLTTQNAFQRGEPVPLAFTVTNVGDQSVTYTFGGGSVHSFEVVRDGVVVFRRPTAGGADYSEVEFGSGMSFTISDTWNQVDDQGQQVPPGKYQIQAFFRAGTINGVPISYRTLSSGPVEVTIR